MVTSQSITVQTTATVLHTSTEYGNEPISVLISVPAGAQTVYIGGENVTTANGMPIEAGTWKELDLGAKEVVYAIVSATTQVVSVLRVGA